MATNKSVQKGHPTTDESRPTDNIQTQIQSLAYQLWLERGAPIGSPESDWFEAEARLNDTRKQKIKAAAH